MVKRNKDVSASLTSVCDGVKQKTGCGLPQAECGAHGASCMGRKARCMGHPTGAIFRVAGNATHSALDVNHPAPRAMQAAHTIGRSPEAVLQGAQGTVQRT
jgi:hypothetical protein